MALESIAGPFQVPEQHPGCRGAFFLVFATRKAYTRRMGKQRNPPATVIMAEADSPVRVWLEEQCEGGIMLAHGLDEALIGVGRRCGQPDIAVYSYQRAVVAMMKQGMTQDEAEEFLEFNTLGSWIGKRTPIFVTEYSGDA